MVTSRGYSIHEVGDRSGLASKASPDIFWLKDESLEESDNLPDSDVLAQEIVETSKARSNNSAKSQAI